MRKCSLLFQWWAPTLLCLASLIGCSDPDEAGTTVEPAQSDSSPSVSTTDTEQVAVEEDTSEEESSPEDDGVDERYAASTLPTPHALGDSHLVVDHLTFPFADDNGNCVGFDLDNTVTEDAEEDVCGWADYESPSGEVGIDNNLAQLTPLFDAVGLGQAFQYLQDSIESSGFFHVGNEWSR